MPTARASRRLAAPAEELWGVMSDPYHLPRWWPRVTRVELVQDGAFTEVMLTSRGKAVRADFEIVHCDREAGTIVWEQRLEGSPFAGVLSHSQTELRVADVEGGSEVSIELRQEPAGRPGSAQGARRRVPSIEGWMLRRAAARTLAEALDGLERISG